LPGRITKLDLISEAPASTTQETVVKVFREDGETIDANINFRPRQSIKLRDILRAILIAQLLAGPLLYLMEIYS